MIIYHLQEPEISPWKTAHLLNMNRLGGLYPRDIIEKNYTGPFKATRIEYCGQFIARKSYHFANCAITLDGKVFPHSKYSGNWKGQSIKIGKVTDKTNPKFYINYHPKDKKARQIITFPFPLSNSMEDFCMAHDELTYAVLSKCGSIVAVMDT